MSESPNRPASVAASHRGALEIRGNAELSNVRRRAGELEVSLWNPRQDAPAGALVDDRQIELRPAEISRVRIEGR